MLFSGGGGDDLCLVFSTFCVVAIAFCESTHSREKIRYSIDIKKFDLLRPHNCQPIWHLLLRVDMFWTVTKRTVIRTARQKYDN